ncbi:hypothetical protein ACT29H_05415 [Thermophagus sp. OGC60D27]|uniref:hypothetical protein n=1 Tax=Thermophagus sp. OGC60D27 TaxID=3458415 RepID=UPI0040377F37
MAKKLNAGWYRDSRGRVPGIYIKHYLRSKEYGGISGQNPWADDDSLTDSTSVSDPNYEQQQYYYHPDHLFDGDCGRKLSIPLICSEWGSRSRPFMPLSSLLKNDAHQKKFHADENFFLAHQIRKWCACFWKKMPMKLSNDANKNEWIAGIGIKLKCREAGLVF